MYEQFTDRARKVMALANQEAQRLEHEYIGTEHILLGLISEGAGVAANVLTNFRLDLIKVRREVEKLVQSGAYKAGKGKLPETPRAKQVIVYAMEETRALGHNYVGTEHLLLGLLREKEGLAADVLTNLGLHLDDVRQEVLNLLGHDLDSPSAPLITKRSSAEASLVAVDIGNSGIKFGQFVRGGEIGVVGEGIRSAGEQALPEPIATLELPIAHDTGRFDLQQLAVWCELNLSTTARWSLASVHRGAIELLTTTIATWTKKLDVNWPIHQISYRDLRLEIRVNEPARVGIDRLLAAVAANRLRTPDRAAIIVDLGTAITIDLVEADGAFAGGAILPGIGMAGRALADQTDALPHVVLAHSLAPPSPLGKSTRAAIEAGLYWGAVGAVGELVSQLTARLPTQPDVFITGGASRTIADSMKGDARVQYAPHLVLAGIALLDEATPGKAGA